MKLPKSTKSPSKSGNDQPPHWLTRAEKVIFRRVVADRKARANSVSATDRDIVADYCLARTRMRQLHYLLHEAFAENSDLDADRQFIFQLTKEIDRTAATCEKLIERLGSLPA